LIFVKVMARVGQATPVESGLYGNGENAMKIQFFTDPDCPVVYGLIAIRNRGPSTEASR
jgi:hypothetical protein